MNAVVVDLGNTRWKMAVVAVGGIGPVTSGSYGAEDELLVAMSQLPGRLHRVLLASVLEPDRTERISERIQQALGLAVTQIRSTDRMPNVCAGYRKPEQLGVDRLLAMVAARAQHAGPLCVVDAGTAVTVDFVDQHGQHLGGFILPGVRMFRDCLLSNTSIPRDGEIDEQAILGRDTPTAVALGARLAVAGLVERFTSGSAALFPGRAMQVVIGGGDAERFIGLLPQPCSKLDHLVLRGLAVLAASGDR